MADITTQKTASPGLWGRLRRVLMPEGQSLVWRLVALQRGLPRQVIAMIGFLLAFRFLFNWSWSMTVAMLISMFLHECGHAYVFWRARIRFIILFLFPLGAVAAPINKKEDERSDQLHWNTISWLLQAGPAVNVALMLLALLIQPSLADPEAAQFARDMVYVNGLLASMNLVPLWTLDAGQLFKVIYSSLEEGEDNWLTGLLLGGSALVLLIVIGIPGVVSWAAVLANTIIRFGWVVFLVMFALGILNKQGRDDPLHAYSRQAMNNRQVLVQVGIYLLLAGATLWVFAGSPL
jgi:Zn-dependent protease